MPHMRFFHPHIFHKGALCELSFEESHHLLRVMRAALDDTLELVNGQGQLAKARLVHKAKCATIALEKIVQEDPPEYPLTLAQGLCRSNHLDFIIEKTTELGVDRIVLFSCERSEKKELSEKQLARLKNLALSAMKQSGRLYLPQITFSAHFFDPSAYSFFGDLEATAPNFSSFLPIKQATQFIIGPEKGFSNEEKERLKKNHAQAVRLGPHILRAETAAVCACALFKASSGKAAYAPEPSAHEKI